MEDGPWYPDTFTLHGRSLYTGMPDIWIEEAGKKTTSLCNPPKSHLDWEGPANSPPFFRVLTPFFAPAAMVLHGRAVARGHSPRLLILFKIRGRNVFMALRSLNLPGIGTKYELETEKKDIIAIFFLKSGNIQMYPLPHDSSPPCVAELTPPEARRIGAILSGAIMEADKESVEIAFSALSDLRISVHTYIIGKHCAGKSLEELQIRARTGATVIAVSRGGRNIINPPPGFTFEEGDAIVAIGEADQLRQLEQVILVT